MNKLFAFILSIFVFSQLIAQKADGDWYGELNVYGQKLPLVLHLDTKSNVGTMDSPKQQMYGAVLENLSIKKSELSFEISRLQLSYKAEIKTDTLIGTLTQRGLDFALNMGRTALDEEENLKPQEPKKPYPYYEENVMVRNDMDAIDLAGTLTMPNKTGIFPAVVLVSGSGPNNRNEEILGHKPFLVLADYLTKQGIAVLRYDDRGVGKSNGDYDIATSEDFKNDAKAMVEYLLTRKEIDPNKIGVIGHSEGGMIASMLAGESDAVVDFIVMLAGTAVPGDSILLMQQNLILKVNGIDEKSRTSLRNIEREAYMIIKNNADGPELTNKLKTYYNQKFDEYPTILKAGTDDVNAFVESKVAVVDNHWMRYFMRYDPRDGLMNISCAVLALNGSSDLQVPPVENLSAIKTALETAPTNNFDVVEIPNLNHLFQYSESGNPAEYGQLEETFSPKALKIISDWILAL